MDSDYSSLSGRELHEFMELVSDWTLNNVFYPVSDNENGPFGFGSGYFKHPLHPDFKPKVKLVGGGLLSSELLPRYEEEPIDYEAERAKQAERIASHWKKIKANKVFQLLSKDANFKWAMDVFYSKKESVKGGYAESFGEFRFLAAATSCVIFLKTEGKAFDWPVPDKKAIGKARNAAWKLLDAIEKDGVKLPEYTKQSSLKSLLVELADQLDTHYKSGRADWTGDNRPYRVFIQVLANDLERYFGEISLEIVMSLAATVKCPLTEGAVRYQLKKSSKNG